MNRRLLSCLLLLALAPLAGAQVSYPTRVKLTARKTYPLYMIGQLTFKSGRTDYLGSGTVIGAKSLLTAGHNVYDPDNGFSTNLVFARNLYGTEPSAVPQATKRRYVFAQYQVAVTSAPDGPDDIRSFAVDSAGLVFPSALCFGAYAAYSTDRNYLSSAHYLVAVGYGAEGRHDGDYPLIVHSTAPYYDTYGSFFENGSFYVEGGMSGGPLLSTNANGVLVQIGIVVSGSTEPVAGGVRLLDNQLLNFIKTYLP